MFNEFNKIIEARNYTKYLEIGVSNGSTFYNIVCQTRIGVDPYNKDMLYPMKSDEFFKIISSDETFDLIFIDGDHECNQVLRDIDNSIKHLSKIGIIFIHDTKPHTELMQRSPMPDSTELCSRGLWTGDVWKAIAKFRSMRSDFSVKTLDIELGLTILERGHNTRIIIPRDDELTYEYFTQHTEYLLNLISYQEFFTGA
jgi:hypothetical protein